MNAGMEATVQAYGGDLRQGFAATRDGPRTITRWTGALRSAMNAAPGHTTLFLALRHAAFTEKLSVLFVHAAIDPSRPLASPMRLGGVLVTLVLLCLPAWVSLPILPSRRTGAYTATPRIPFTPPLMIPSLRPSVL